MQRPFLKLFIVRSSQTQDMSKDPHGIEKTGARKDINQNIPGSDTPRESLYSVPQNKEAVFFHLFL